MTTTPAAYLRRSYVDPDSPGDISREAQRAAVRKLAAADGHNGNLVEYDDWGISADIAKSAKRTAYSRLLADMEVGHVSAVYAFDVDRLYRDPRDLIRLQDAAQAHRVRIVTMGGPLAIGEGDDPAAEGFAFMGAVFGRMELQKAKKRNRAAREARKARGDRFGHPPYGFVHVKDATGRIVRAPNPAQPFDPILDAYHEAGTVLGTARLLNERGVPGPKGGKWYTSQLTRVIQTHAPTLLPRRGASGKRIRSVAVLSQVVRCHCGQVMTPNTHRRQMYCSKGHIDAEHGRYTVQEKSLIPWLADRIEVEGRERIEKRRWTISSDDTASRRSELEEDRRRAGISYQARAISDEEFVKTIEHIDADLAELPEEDEGAATFNIRMMGKIDLAGDPAEVNPQLRAMIESVHLDEAMQPVEVKWRG